jgi:hypothetical protein
MKLRVGLAVAGVFALVLGAGQALADANKQTKGAFDDKFRQLDVDLPTPNTYRAASGAPGEAYWQQKADYVINASLDEAKKRITGAETVTYHNQSPHTLSYLWFQLDQNIFKPTSGSVMSGRQTVFPGAGPAAANPATDTLSVGLLKRLQSLDDRPQGYEIASVTDGAGKPLHYVIVDTMMRVDLTQPLPPGKVQAVKVGWAFNIVDNNVFGGRSGYEHLADSNTDQFFQAQWFPRMVAYTDYTGWQHKQFLGSGEFTLEFGDYDVSITVPADHVMGATGVLQNPEQTLTATQRSRLVQAKTSDKPIYIVTPDEAAATEKKTATATKTWRWKATNVRDFAWASSRSYIWDAMGVKQPEGPDVMAQSFYPSLAEPLWSQYSTRAVAHTIDTYSKFSFPYPYPNAISVNTWAGGGMEYPMISFNGSRPVKDPKTGVKTYSRAAKYGLIGVVIHEVGHNYFPMIVNSDERQWTWMDEGLNSFLQYMSELQWDENFPSRGGRANQLDSIGDYMMSENQVPIMTNSESIAALGNNAYAKPTAALTVLRETVMGRELFDHAFKQYAQRWRFKRPTPSDFFRTMEDASGVDLDWFWRAWFYTTDHVDVGVTGLREYRLSTRDPKIEAPLAKQRLEAVTPDAPTAVQNRKDGIKTYSDRHPEADDFYDKTGEFEVNNKDLNDYETFKSGLSADDKAVFERALKENPYFYFLDFENVGGIPTPLPLKFTYADGSTKEVMIPAEIWRYSQKVVTKLFVETKKVTSVELDAAHQIADANRANNAWPSRSVPSRIELFRQNGGGQRNQMSDALQELKTKQPPQGANAPLAPAPQ